MRVHYLSALLLAVGGTALLATCVGGTADEAGYAERIGTSDAAPASQESEPDAAQRELEAVLVRLGEAFPGTVGIAVGDVVDGVTVGYRMREPMPQQSVTKLWVAMTAYAMRDEGAFSFAEPVTVTPADFTVFHQPIRAEVLERGALRTTYGDLAVRALTLSDNTANDLLLRRIGGPTAVAGFLRRARLPGIVFGTDERSKQAQIAGLDWQPAYSTGRSFYDAREKVPPRDRQRAFDAYHADPMDGASAAGIAEALARLARGELLSPASTASLLAILERTRSGPRRLRGGLAEGWRIAHKTGTGQVFAGEQSGYNDVGILIAPDGSRYAVAVMIARTRASYAKRMELMQAVTRAVIAHHDRAGVPPRGRAPTS